MRSGGNAAKAVRRATKPQPSVEVSRPKRKLRAVEAPEEERPKRTRSLALASTWGRPPERATHWSIGKKEGNGWVRKDWKERGEQTAINIWPLAMLDAELVCDRWFPGEYRVTWIGTVQGKRQTLGVGRTVKVLPKEAEGEGATVSQQAVTPAAPPAPVAAPLPDALGQFQTLWGISQQQKDAELARERASFDQRLANQAATYDQLFALQAKMAERPASPEKEERMARLERRIRRLTRALEEREEEPSTGLAATSPTSPMGMFFAAIAPYAPMLIEMIPAALQRLAGLAGTVSTPRSEVHRP